jgi:hypothetical protein
MNAMQSVIQDIATTFEHELVLVSETFFEAKLVRFVAKCEALRYDLDVDECSEGTHDCKIDRESCVNVPGRYQCHQLTQEDSNCPPGYEPNPSISFLCQG